MNDSDDGQHGGGPVGPVGSVSDEAAKLFGALTDWARDQGADHGGPTGGGGEHPITKTFRDVREHLATGEDCRYCPLCQVIHVVRHTSPEVRVHLSVAASSLIQAAAGLLATPPGDRQPSDRHPPAAPMEKIDLESGADAGPGGDEDQ